MAKKKNIPLLAVAVLVVLAFVMLPLKVVFPLLLLGGILLLAYAFVKVQRPPPPSAELPPNPLNAQARPGVKAWAETSRDTAIRQGASADAPAPTRPLSTQPQEQTAPLPAERTVPANPSPSPRIGDDDLVSVQVVVPQTAEHRIPAPPPGLARGVYWVPPGESVTVAGLDIPGGMLYVGIPQKNGPEPDPSLINIRLPLASECPALSLKLMGYWPSYATMSPAARTAYLTWLAGGRKDPTADIGYVFVFFYGLERRVLEDMTSEHKGGAELTLIVAEIQRLLAAYGDNRSFKGYASRFLEFAVSAVNPETPGSPPPPPDERGMELPLSVRIGLGLFARDQRPVPAEWALSWLRADPNTYLRTPALRCTEQFEILFTQMYSEVFQEGLQLPVNRTKLKISYQPASPGLRYAEYSRTLSGLPDVSTVTAPIAELRELANRCSDALDAYSRYLGRNPDKAGALEGLLLLPVALWPRAVRAELESLKTRVGDGMVLMTFGELADKLQSAGPLSRDKIVGLARALETLSLGIEPDVLAGSKAPKAEDRIVLFPTLPEEGALRHTPAYEAATITLDLSCAAARADGEASSHELLHLSRQIDSWAHLSDAHRKRLKARLRLGLEQPPTLASLKKKMEPLATDARRTIGQFLAHLCQADGQVSPNEVKFLERVYKTLGLESQLVYSDLHVTPSEYSKSSSSQGTAGSAASAGDGAAPSFKLDHARIAQLHKETEAVSALLASVFTDESPDESASPLPDVPVEEPTQVESSILGLSEDYSSFIRHLVSRPLWTRGDLGDVAADMELMLDGALEHINEAMLDMFDAPLTEGDDPIEINQELLEQLPL